MSTPVPGSAPIQPTPSPEQRPGLGAQEDIGNRPFSLSPEPLKEGGPPSAVQSEKPTPMEASKEKPGKPQWTQEELSSKIEVLNEKLESAKTRLKGPERQKLTPDHEAALKKVTEKMTPEMRKIANKSDQQFTMPSYAKGEGVLGFVTNWISSSQDTLKGALSFLQSKPNLQPGDLLAMQYSVQRSMQMGEIFSNVIGASVSGIKTLMSTQLG